MHRRKGRVKRKLHRDLEERESARAGVKFAANAEFVRERRVCFRPNERLEGRAFQELGMVVSKGSQWRGGKGDFF